MACRLAISSKGADNQLPIDPPVQFTGNHEPRQVTLCSLPRLTSAEARQRVTRFGCFDTLFAKALVFISSRPLVTWFFGGSMSSPSLRGRRRSCQKFGRAKVRWRWTHADGSEKWTIPVLLLSHEPNEPPHVHVDRDDASAKFWLDPISLARNLGFSAHELRGVDRIIRDNQSELLEAWNDWFSNQAG